MAEAEREIVAGPERSQAGVFSRLNLQGHEDKILLLLALVISAVVGLVVTAFVALTERLGRVLLTAGAAQRLLIPLVGSLVGGWLLYKFFPEARGSGIPQTRVALLLQNGFIRFRTVVGKFFCCALSLGSGIALGREGPSVHVGAGIASSAGRWLGLSEQQIRALIPVGTAAAVAAAFNTPLAAVLFTLEEILANLHARVVGTVVIGAATSWMVLRLILGDEPLFHVPAYHLVHPVEFLIYALLGVLGAFASTAFVKSLLWQRQMFMRMSRRWEPYQPAFGGLMVGLLALAAPGVLGVGYNLVGDALNGRLALNAMALLLVLKLIATTSSYASGNAGGIFGPALFIGAMLGGSVGSVAHALLPDITANAGAYALVGMGAAFAGIVRTPMTSVIMIFEVTRDYNIIVPLMIANLCSYFLSAKFQAVPVYEALSLQDGIRMPSPEHAPEPLTVNDAMRPLAEPAEGEDTELPREIIYRDETLDAALQRMSVLETAELTVVSRMQHRVIGVIGRKDILAAYSGLTGEKTQERAAAASARNWLPAATIVTVAAILLASGLVFWQRSSRASVGAEAYKRAQELMARGQNEDAVLSLRTALAYTPENLKAREALGMALLATGHTAEAETYLSEVAKEEPNSGPAILGLARAAFASGDKQRALDLTARAIASQWPPDKETLRSDAQFEHAELLASTGRRTQAVGALMSIIDQHGDDPAIGKKAADTVKRIGTAQESEQAALMLSTRFPADPGAWLRLAEARSALAEDGLALQAYEKVIQLDPEDKDARRGIERTQALLSLDPTRKGLSSRERSGRWDEILRRIAAAADSCGRPGLTGSVTPLLKARGTPEQKAQQARSLWPQVSACNTDAALARLMTRLKPGGKE